MDTRESPLVDQHLEVVLVKQQVDHRPLGPSHEGPSKPCQSVLVMVEHQPVGLCRVHHPHLDHHAKHRRQDREPRDAHPSELCLEVCALYGVRAPSPEKVNIFAGVRQPQIR